MDIFSFLGNFLIIFATTDPLPILLITSVTYTFSQLCLSHCWHVRCAPSIVSISPVHCRNYFIFIFIIAIKIHYDFHNEFIWVSFIISILLFGLIFVSQFHNKNILLLLRRKKMEFRCAIAKALFDYSFYD